MHFGFAWEDLLGCRNAWDKDFTNTRDHLLRKSRLTLEDQGIGNMDRDHLDTEISHLN